jgi:hypothetical protein
MRLTDSKEHEGHCEAEEQHGEANRLAERGNAVRKD